MGKCSNKKTLSRMFHNLKETLNDRDKHNGKVYALDDEECESCHDWKELRDGQSERALNTDLI